MLEKVLLAIGLSVLGGCAGTAGHASPAAAPAVAGNAALTHTVAAILAGEIPPGGTVTVVGYYRGWNLLGEVPEGPPVRRSDWVIKDASGAIYVRANAVKMGRADKPGSVMRLAPQDKGETGRIVRIRGVVQVTPQGQHYVEPVSIEILD